MCTYPSCRKISLLLDLPTYLNLEWVAATIMVSIFSKLMQINFQISVQMEALTKVQDM